MSRYATWPHGYNNPTAVSQLVGRVIQSAAISGEHSDVLTFATDADPVVWDVEGECCSDSQFTDLKLDAVLGKRITDVKEVESIVDPALDPATLRQFACNERYDSDWKAPEGFEEAPQESEQIYGVRLAAEDGAVGFVIHRNWSNGYYGGTLFERVREAPTYKENP